MSCDEPSINMLGNVESEQGISPITVIKIKKSGMKIQIKYNYIIPLEVFEKRDDYELVWHADILKRTDPTYVNNEDYDTDFTDHRWIKYKDLRIIVMKNYFIKMPLKYEIFEKDELGWKNQFNERLYLDGWKFKVRDY